VQAIGLMSGTSLDGVDVAVIETDGERISAFGPTGYRAYAEGERALLRQGLGDATGMTDRAQRPGVLAQAEALVTRAHGDAIADYLEDNELPLGAIDIIGFHGQTVLHRPERRLTVQIGDGHALARRFGLPVAFDFRAADVAAGGQGAPLVPVFHGALVATLDRPRPVAVLNIGGVANITYCDDDKLIACDTGPGNALLDDFMRARTGRSFDTGGAKAARGRVDQAFVEQVLRNPFFALPPPKSLDRNAFASVSAALADSSVADGAATLAALTAACVARVIPLLLGPGSWRAVARTIRRCWRCWPSGLRRPASRPRMHWAGRAMRWKRRLLLIWRCVPCAGCRSRIHRPRVSLSRWRAESWRANRRHPAPLRRPRGSGRVSPAARRLSR
jgi:anhydro-N-acetylmuramic acid kinase